MNIVIEIFIIWIGTLDKNFGLLKTRLNNAVEISDI